MDILTFEEDGERFYATPDCLIECGDHKFAPYCLVCDHLFKGISKEYIRIEGQGGLQDDYICPKCGEQFPTIDIDQLRCVCIFCARDLIKDCREIGETGLDRPHEAG